MAPEELPKRAPSKSTETAREVVNDKHIEEIKSVFLRQNQERNPKPLTRDEIYTAVDNVYAQGVEHNDLEKALEDYTFISDVVSEIISSRSLSKRAALSDDIDLGLS